MTGKNISTENCPNFRLEDIDNYFLYTKNTVTGILKNCHRQLKKSHKFGNEKYIDNMEIHSIRDGSSYCYVRDKCKPSMKDKVLVVDGKTAIDYSLNVCIVSKTGKIESAYCNCKCGLAEVCSHVGGLLQRPNNTKICIDPKSRKAT